jgi:hypothetical protein
MSLYRDLLITDDDFTLDGENEPALVTDRLCIAQDILHMIRDTGLLIEMIGNRDGQRIAQLSRQIEIDVENDIRIKPGTAKVTRTDVGTFFLVADTVDFGPVRFGL